MEKNKLQIRVATKEDAEALLAIYAPYVEKTAITFEYEVPSIEEFRCRIQETLKKYPYLVAEKNGKIVGYAYAGAFHVRPAYDWAVETSIYVSELQKGEGIGKALYKALEEQLSRLHILNLNACIAYPETAYASIRTLATGWLGSFTSAGISSTAGITWYGWKSISGRIRRIQRR